MFGTDSESAVLEVAPSNHRTIPYLTFKSNTSAIFNDLTELVADWL